MHLPGLRKIMLLLNLVRLLVLVLVVSVSGGDDCLIELVCLHLLRPC